MKKINVFFLVFIFSISNLFADQNVNFNKWKENFKILALKNLTSDITVSNVFIEISFFKAKILKFSFHLLKLTF